ncbi:conjugal transfer mating pair stabilization protein TraN (plasmid) [Escherichia coli]|nr:conjugal transfer mating pair stabilization protein TraN [Escherichia coli]
MGETSSVSMANAIRLRAGQSNDFAEAVSQLAALAAAGKDVAALNGVDVRAFTGQAKFCKKAAAGYSNCL